MRNRIACGAALVLTIGLGCSKGSATVAISQQAEVCDSCRIQLRPYIVLSSSSAEAYFLQYSKPVDTPLGGFLVAPVGKSMAGIAEFGPSGSFIKVVGRRGEGPAEFPPILDLAIDPGDSVVVLAQNRLGKLGPSLEQVRVQHLPSRAGRILVLGGGRFLLNTFSGSPNVFTTFNDLLLPTGTEGPPHTKDIESLQYVLAADREGGFWAASVNYNHEIMHFDSTGREIANFALHTPWFSPWTEADQVSADVRIAPPRPRVTGLSLDSAGHLWVTGLTASPSWKPDAAVKGSEHERAAVNVVEWGKYYESIIEVADTLGRVLAIRNVTDILLGSTRGGLVWGFLEEPETGFLRIKLWKPELLPMH